MKIKINLILTLALIFIFSNGCQKQGPVEIISDEDDSKLIELTTLNTASDSLFENTTLDSSGYFDPRKHYAKMIFSSIRFDRPFRKDSIIQAEAIFFDKSNPIFHHGRMVAYPSFDIGNLFLNDDSLFKLPRRMKMGSGMTQGGDTIIGFRYHLRKQYEFSAAYEWRCTGKNTIDSFRIPFNHPREIRVLNLNPTFISVSEPLNVKWNCTNDFIQLFISGENEIPPHRHLIPILHLKITNTKGEITIPSKILKMLPINKFQRFIFTFSSEQKSKKNIGGYPDPVLIHAASIHNIAVNLRP